MTNKVYCLLKAQKSGVFDLQIIICRLNWGQTHRYERIFRDLYLLLYAATFLNLSFLSMYMTLYAPQVTMFINIAYMFNFLHLLMRYYSS